MPSIRKSVVREGQRSKERTYHPRHRGRNRAALVASRNARRALMARYA